MAAHLYEMDTTWLEVFCPSLRNHRHCPICQQRIDFWLHCLLAGSQDECSSHWKAPFATKLPQGPSIASGFLWVGLRLGRNRALCFEMRSHFIAWSQVISHVTSQVLNYRHLVPSTAWNNVACGRRFYICFINTVYQVKICEFQK